jgi:putative hydrolase of HD superfamily
MASTPNVKRLIELQSLLLKFQIVERRTRHPETRRRENDVEHSYHLAMAAWFLAPHFNLDKDRAIRVALAHDLVEIYAGDTFAFAEQADIDGKDEREEIALEQLRRECADFPELLECIEDYKHKGSEEAKFVYALDKIMPAIMNYLDGGETWRDHKVTIEKFQAEKEKKIPQDSVLYLYYTELLAMLRETPEYFHTDTPISGGNPSQQG